MGIFLKALACYDTDATGEIHSDTGLLQVKTDRLTDDFGPH